MAPLVMPFSMGVFRLLALASWVAAVHVADAQGLPETAGGDARSGALAVRVFTAAYWGTGAHTDVLIGAEVHGLTGLPDRAGSAPQQVDIRYDVLRGPSHVSGRSIAVRLDDVAMRREAIAGGIRVLTRPPFSPGRYRLRVTATDQETGHAGSATHDFEVPAFADTSVLMMSGVVLTSSQANGVTHAEVEDDSRLLPILARPPSARRELSGTEQLEVHTEFYERPDDADLDQRIDVVTRVLSGDGRLVWEIKDVGQSETLPGGRFGYAHSALVPLATLAPGRYLLQVSAEGRYGASVSDSVTFSVK